MSERPMNPVFEAIVGQEQTKKALMCLIANKNLKGVLIKGPPGTAKSTLARSITGISGKDVVNVPLNITDDQLFGGLDLEAAVEKGRKISEEGLLRRADGNFLYIDNVNLFDKKKLNMIMNCLEAEEVLVEREGVSSSYPFRSSVIATMDPIEQDMGDEISDMFDICVYTETITETNGRRNVIFVNTCEKDREKSASEDILAHRIGKAAEILKKMMPDGKSVSSVTRLCTELDIEGHRGDLAVIKTAMTLAALDGSETIRKQDITDAAVMCLVHRRKKKKEADVASDSDEREDEPVDLVEKEQIPDTDLASVPETTTDPEPEYDDTDERIADEVLERFRKIDDAESLRLHNIAGVGKRRKDIITNSGNGRYGGFRIPRDRPEDPALDATLRAAAPYQKIRDRKGLSISIEPQDIRDKIRTRRDSGSFLFLVDMSGSLVDSKMIGHMINAIRAMLNDGYAKRDKVALMTFNKYDAHLLVPFTRSVEKVYKELENAPRGDNTPLGLALLEAKDYVTKYLRKNPDERCYIMIITDGETTKSVLKRNIATVELKEIALSMEIPRTEWIVIDSKLGSSKYNNAERLANLLGAKYLTLDELDKC